MPAGAGSRSGRPAESVGPIIGRTRSRVAEHRRRQRPPPRPPSVVSGAEHDMPWNEIALGAAVAVDDARGPRRARSLLTEASRWNDGKQCPKPDASPRPPAYRWPERASGKAGD
jgi:hypothetical protein